MPSSRRSEKHKVRIPSPGEALRITSHMIRQLPSRVSKTVRNIGNIGRKLYKYNEPDDLSGETTMEDFLYIDPSVINPNILKNGPGKLNKEQRQALKALLHIKRLTKDYKKGEEKENAINRLKQDIRDELNRNSSFNIEVNKVIKKFTEGLNLSKGGNRRTRSRRTRRRI